MKKHLPNIDLVIVALSSPIKIGLYKNGEIFEEIESNEKTSEYLPKIYNELKENYHIKKIIYARGPGSFMSIKLCYVFLKTLQLTQDIEIQACDGFEFSKNRPIKAMGKLYFTKEDGKISLKKFEEEIESLFELPKNIKDLNLDNSIEPLYILPAV